MRYFGPVAIVLGLVAVIVGALLQINGAAAVFFCSTIGLGIVLIVVGACYWIVKTLRHQTPGSIAA
jgi:flagellar biosynthesis protein FliQ